MGAVRGVWSLGAWSLGAWPPDLRSSHSRLSPPPPLLHFHSYLRAAEAHLALNERATVKLAVQELQQALALDEDNAKIKAQLKDAQLTWEADFD